MLSWPCYSQIKSKDLPTLRDLVSFTPTAGRQQSWDASPAGLRQNPCQVQGQACEIVEEQWRGDMEEQHVFRGSIVKPLLV